MTLKIGVRLRRKVHISYITQARCLRPADCTTSAPDEQRLTQIIENSWRDAEQLQAFVRLHFVDFFREHTLVHELSKLERDHEYIRHYSA